MVSESTETTAGIDLSALYIIDNNLAPIMSESYGGCEAELGAGGNQFYSTLWEQAAAQGITVLISSGDSGSAGCDSANAGETAAQYGLAVSGLASTPFNVAVGGTDFNITASNALHVLESDEHFPVTVLRQVLHSREHVERFLRGLRVARLHSTALLPRISMKASIWLPAAEDPAVASIPSGTFPTVTCSGGYSKPSWQSGTGVPNDSARDIPDLSLFAGNGLHGSFYVICQMDANSGAGAVRPPAI